MPLGMEVGLGPDDIVLDGDPVWPQQTWAENWGAPVRPFWGGAGSRSNTVPWAESYLHTNDTIRYRGYLRAPKHHQQPGRH